MLMTLYIPDKVSEIADEREDNHDLVKDGLPFESSHCFDHLKEVPPQKESNVGSSENCISIGLAVDLTMHNQLVSIFLSQSLSF